MQHSKCAETVKKDEIIIICDFSENDTCKMSEEIQSAHFGASKNHFTLHTGVIYLGHDSTSYLFAFVPYRRRFRMILVLFGLI